MAGPTGSPWDVLIAGIQDTTGHFVGRRDREHAEHREDRFRAQDRANFLGDRSHMERLDARKVRRMVADARAAGISPLAAMGAQLTSPAAVMSGGGSYAGSGDTSYPRYTPIDLGAARVNNAQAKLLEKQADLVDEQIADSRLARATQAYTPDKMVEDIINPQRTSHVRYGGAKIQSNSYFSDAQTYEDRYGELGGSLLGLTNIPADIISNVVRSLSEAYGHSSGSDPIYRTYE